MSENSKRKLASKSIAADLRRWREERGWTRKQAAEHFGVKAKTIESWEYGYRKPNGAILLEKLWGTRRPR
jgi:transcriptional regulator with XRE-family HTH domain